MKYILLLFAFSTPYYSLCQVSHLRGRVIDSQSNKSFWGATLLFKQGDKIITGGTSDSAGVFTVKTIPVGSYNVDITAIGYRTETLSNVVVSSDTLLSTISFPGPCKYVYPEGLLISCVGGHTDHIIPMVYGLPGKKLMRQAKKEEVHLAGCQLTGCDPKYYCLVHKKEL
jgi:hypothetical protein